jgi:hypothetical protein
LAQTLKPGSNRGVGVLRRRRLHGQPDRKAGGDCAAPADPRCALHTTGYRHVDRTSRWRRSRVHNAKILTRTFWRLPKEERHCSCCGIVGLRTDRRSEIRNVITQGARRDRFAVCRRLVEAQRGRRGRTAERYIETYALPTTRVAFARLHDQSRAYAGLAGAPRRIHVWLRGSAGEASRTHWRRRALSKMVASIPDIAGLAAIAAAIYCRERMWELHTRIIGKAITALAVIVSSGLANRGGTPRASLDTIFVQTCGYGGCSGGGQDATDHRRNPGRRP